MKQQRRLLCLTGALAYLVCLYYISTKPYESSKILVKERMGLADVVEIKMIIVVLTAFRHDSLRRLLTSLSRAEYGLAVIDLQINVDISKTLDVHTLEMSEKCTRVAKEFSWFHGRKTVFRRSSHAGLSNSWFEAPYHLEGYEYISIMEDDMQVSKHFFRVFASLHRLGVFTKPHLEGFCLHPGDWEVDVPRSCWGAVSKILYESPEPCNWGPIWKYDEWRKFIQWALSMKAKGILPLVPNDIAYNYNKYVLEGKDVQSSWVWRYNFDEQKRQVRYSFKKCLQGEEQYLAINHKEPGEHFKEKVDLENDPVLLQMDIDEVLALFVEEKYSKALPFGGYVRGSKSLH